MWRKLWLGLLLTCFSLVACQQPASEEALPPAIACEKIIDPALLAVDLDTIPKDEALAWITEHYGERRLMTMSELLDHQMLEMKFVGFEGSIMTERPDWESERVRLLTEGVVRRGSARGTTYEWMAKGNLYRLVYHSGVQNQRLATIDIEFDTQPTLSDIERCYGNPEYYKATFYAYHYGNWLTDLLDGLTHDTSFSLYYPEQGLYFSDYRKGDGHNTPDITPATSVKMVYLMRAGTVVDMMYEVLPTRDHTLNDVTPFPGTWEEMKYQ